MYIITGMHRSGTSFTAQVLNHLGADFGDPDLLFPADKWNQSGYFENTEVIDINNKAILGLNSKIEHWLQAPETRWARLINSVESAKWKYLFFPRPGAIAKRAMSKRSEIERVHQQFRGKFLKDPRFCLTLSTWAALGPIEGVVFSFRNPYSVAGSIKRREGLPKWFGYRYWYYHIKNFISQCPADVPVLFVDFDRFFDSASKADEFARMIAYMNTSDMDRIESLDAVLNIKLRTQTRAAESYNPIIDNAYQGLHDLWSACAGGKPLLLKDHPGECRAILGDE